MEDRKDTFECQQCGRCCSGKSGYVWLQLQEIRALAEHFDLSPDEFGVKYLRRVGARYSLVESQFSGDCIYLEDSRCKVYHLRPEQCRRFPFWEGSDVSEKDLELMKSECPGVNTK